MAGRNKVLKAVVLATGAVAIVCAAGWIYVVRSFRIGLSPASLDPLVTILKKTGSDIAMIKQPNNSPPLTPPRGYLVAYEQNPESFKADAKLFDTWQIAVQLSTSVLEHGPSGNWVQGSSRIDYVKPENRVDPWGHTFCLLRRNGSLLVISGGPNAPGSPICNDISMTAGELAKFPSDKLLQSPSGSLILVTDGAHLPKMMPPSN